MNLFYQQPDFVTRDPSFNFEAESGIVLHNQENLYIRLSHWVSPERLEGSSVLDIGSKTSVAAGYVLFNGASRYVGVDVDQEMVKIAEENIKKYYPSSDTSVIHSSAEEFVEKCNEKFDIVFLGRVIHSIASGVHFLKKLSQIANTIIIEDVHPLLMPIVYLTDQLGYETDLKSLMHHLEYYYSLSESHSLDLFEQIKLYPQLDDNTHRLSKTLYSIGFLKGVLIPLGFSYDLSSYESIKTIFPEEYGYGLYKNRDGIKKFIIRFDKNV